MVQEFEAAAFENIELLAKEALKLQPLVNDHLTAVLVAHHDFLALWRLLEIAVAVLA